MTRLIYHNAKQISFTPDAKVRGNAIGKFLWALIYVDESDLEESTVSLWRADSEEELYNEYLEEYGDGEEEEGFKQHLDDIWNELLLPRKLGNF